MRMIRDLLQLSVDQAAFSQYHLFAGVFSHRYVEAPAPENIPAAPAFKDPALARGIVSDLRLAIL